MTEVTGVRLPRRSRRYGVGKEIGGAVYLHRTYETVLGDPLEAAKRHLAPAFEYTVVKYNPKTGMVSFIQSPDFDTAPEPTVGTICIVSPEGQVRWIEPPADPWIYHHKWLFVGDDYMGFDLEESKRRSLDWMTLPGIDRRRIGKRSSHSNAGAPLSRGMASG